MKLNPVIHGVTATSLLTLVYFGIVSYLESSSYAIGEFLSILYLVIPLIVSFGVQVTLYSYARQHLHIAHQGSASVVASGGLSTTAMIACCAHHLTDVAPLLGIVAVTSTLVTYKPLFVVVGLLSNIIGILVILTIIQRHHLYSPSGALARIMHPKIGKLRDLTIVISLTIIAGLSLYFFTSQEGITPTRTSVTETVTPPPRTTAPETTSPPKTTEIERIFSLPDRTLNQRGLTIKVMPYPISYSREVKFKVNFDVHAGSLDFDVIQVALLEDDSGNMYRPKGWDGSPPGGHHREGDLSFPLLIGTPSSIKLVMKGIRDVDWLFEWKFAS